MKHTRKIILTVALSAVLVPSMACAAFTKPLTIGVRDPEVSLLQRVLKEWGFFNYPEITGYYGSFTAQAVKAFQESKGIEPVGEVGPITRSVMNSLLGDTPLSSTNTAVSTPPIAGVVTTPTTTSGSSVFSTVDSYSGDAVNYTPRTPSRWSVITSASGDSLSSKKYFLNTTNYTEQSGSRLGELSVLSNRLYSNFTLTLKARTNETLTPGTFNDFAVVFGYVNENNYRYMMFNSHAPYTQLFAIINGQRVTLGTATRAGITDTNEHNIDVIRAGLTVVVRVDGQEILRTSDTKLGTAGLVGVGSYDDSAFFDDISVSSSATVPPPPVQAPAVPTLSASVVSSTQVNVSWNDVAGETGYVLERSSAQSGWSAIATLGANVTSFNNTGLLANTAYSYRIKSQNNSAESVYSAVVQVVTSSTGSSAKLTASNTGPTNPSILTPRFGVISIAQNGTILENFDLVGQIVVNASNVTIKNFRIRDGGNRFGAAIQIDSGTNIVIEDGDIAMSVSDNGIFGSNYTARRLHMHDMRTDAFGAGSNVVIENSYIHNIGIGYNPNCNDNSSNFLDHCVHTDGIQTRGNSSNVTLRNNNFDTDSHVSGIIQMNDNGGAAYSISNWLVENNWFEGSAIMLRSYSNPTIRFLNNRIGRNAVYGVLFNTPPVYDVNAIVNNPTTWKCNIWMNAGPVGYPKGSNGIVIDPDVDAGQLVYPQDTCTTPPSL